MPTVEFRIGHNSPTLISYCLDYQGNLILKIFGLFAIVLCCIAFDPLFQILHYFLHQTLLALFFVQSRFVDERNEPIFYHMFSAMSVEPTRDL